MREMDFSALNLLRCALADLLGAGSNHLADMLTEWSAILKHSSLGRAAHNTNERKDESAPRDSHLAAVRRRKIA